MTVVQVRNRLEEKLRRAFSPTLIEVIDESANHADHAGAREGGETHFRVRIISPMFVGLSRVERQRQIYGVLADELKDRVHALALTTLTPDEASKS